MSHMPSGRPPGSERVNHLFCVAPMMECTDRHDRYLLRLLSRRALLYTEMVAAAALVHGDRERLLGFNDAEHPVALQVGGCDPGDMAECARYAESHGYDEINVNVGCPSHRVQSGRFGACLMAEPELVAECVAGMIRSTAIPVTVKCRIGLDDDDPELQLDRFVETVASAGCQTFIVHARKAWLKGLSPKQNREVPPLDYARVYRLKQRFRHLEIIINGGVTSLDQAEEHLAFVDGVMMGRAAYSNPYLLSQVDRRFFSSRARVPRREYVLEQYLEYCRQELEKGCRLNHLTRHLFGLFQGQPGARRWRRILSEYAGDPATGLDVVRQASRQCLEAGRQRYVSQTAQVNAGRTPALSV